MKRSYGVIYVLVVLCVGLLVGINSQKLLNYTKPQTSSNNSSFSSTTNITDGLNFIKEMQSFLLTLNSSMSVDKVKMLFAEKVYLLSNSSDSRVVDYVASELLKGLNKDFTDTKSLLTSISLDLTSLTTSLGSGIDDLILNYDAKVQITSTTAASSSEAGSSYSAKLNGYIYYAEGTSTKWVVLLHGYMMNGRLMAQALADMYLDQGYNVLAPDLRGFGNSEGSVAMGYLESLDTWDWLTYINNSNNKYIGSRKASEVVIHGVSLGGATTLQTWTQVNFGRDLTTKNVIGLVDDCGYDSMTGIIDGMTSVGLGTELLQLISGKDSLSGLVGEDNVKNLLLNVIKVGIKDSEFDVKQNSFHSSRKMSNVPLYIIHGTSDTTVPFSISKNIVSVKAKQAGLLYKFWEVSNMPHAFIIVGVNKDDYKSNLKDFLTYAENRDVTNVNNSSSSSTTSSSNNSSSNSNSSNTNNSSSSTNNSSSNNSTSNNTVTDNKNENTTAKNEESKTETKKETKKEKSFWQKLWEGIKNFFVNLFD